MNLLYKIATKEDFYAVFEVIKNIFAPYETMNKAVGIEPEDFSFFAQVVAQVAINNGLSTVIYDQNTHESVGLVLIKDFAIELPEEIIEGIPQKMFPVLDVLDKLAYRYTKPRTPLQVGEVAELFIGTIHKDYEGKGISTQLWNLGAETAQKNGFKKIVSTVTGAGSQRIAQKLGFSFLYRIRYKTFEFEGRRHFENIDSVPFCYFVEKELH